MAKRAPRTKNANRCKGTMICSEQGGVETQRCSKFRVARHKHRPAQAAMLSGMGLLEHVQDAADWGIEDHGLGDTPDSNSRCAVHPCCMRRRSMLHLGRARVRGRRVEECAAISSTTSLGGHEDM